MKLYHLCSFAPEFFILYFKKLALALWNGLECWVLNLSGQISHSLLVIVNPEIVPFCAYGLVFGYCVICTSFLIDCEKLKCICKLHIFQLSALQI